MKTFSNKPKQNNSEIIYDDLWKYTKQQHHPLAAAFINSPTDDKCNINLICTKISWQHSTEEFTACH